MPVSREEVEWCYRLLLGREPESEQVVQHHMRSASRNALRATFLHSTEFASAAAVPVPAGDGTLPSLPMNLERLDIDVDVDDWQLVQILGRVKATWEHLGITGAHHSVLTQPEFLPENLAGSIENFWASGVADAAALKQILARHGCTGMGDKTGVEYGCGVGRFTVPFAAECRKVHAYDISSAHLTYARSRAGAMGRDNISFHVCSENPIESLEPCDIFYSMIVFQHNPPPVIKILVQRALQALRPDGIAVFQMPTYMRDYSFKVERYLQGELVREMEMHCLPQHVIFDLVAHEGCTLLEVREDGCIGFPLSNTFVVRKKPG